MARYFFFSRSFLAACSMNLLLFFSFYLILPMLPGYMRGQFNVGHTTIGAIMAAYAVGALVMRPFAGYWVDIYRRKPLFLCCYISFTILFLGYFFTGKLMYLAITRLLHGLAFGVLTISATALVIDTIPQERLGTGIGIYGTASAVAMALGPMVGLFLTAHYGYLITFTCAFCTAVIGLCAGLLITPSKQFYAPKKPEFSLKQMFLPQGKHAFVSIFFASFFYGNLIYFIELYGRERNIGGSIGYIFTFFALGLICSRFFSGRIIDKGKLIPVVITGKLVLVATGVVFVYVPAEWAFFGSALFMGLGYGFLLPSYQTLFNTLAMPFERGRANATFLTGFDAGIGVAAVVAGIIAEYTSFDVVYILSTGAMAFSLVYFQLVVAKDYEQRRIELVRRVDS